MRYNSLRVRKTLDVNAAGRRQPWNWPATCGCYPRERPGFVGHDSGLILRGVPRTFRLKGSWHEHYRSEILGLRNALRTWTWLFLWSNFSQGWWPSRDSHAVPSPETRTRHPCDEERPGSPRQRTTRSHPSKATRRPPAREMRR